MGNNGSCQSPFIVAALFMHTVSGWEDPEASTHVPVSGSCALTHTVGWLLLFTMWSSFVLLLMESAATLVVLIWNETALQDLRNYISSVYLPQFYKRIFPISHLDLVLFNFEQCYQTF